jgi:3-isopropylmalate/(R)-2-methylmalate dehydratase small subunit
MEPIRVIEGAVSVLDRPDVDTDQIIPQHFLKRLERRGFGEFLFYDWAREPGWSLPSTPILATGRNFGCGSSREQAPWALEDYGFRAIVAPSFADIFYMNCTKIGLLPVPLPEDAVRKVMECSSARVDLEAQQVTCPGLVARFEIDQPTRERLLNGLDEVSLTLQKLQAIEAYESSRTFVLPDTSRI